MSMVLRVRSKRAVPLARRNLLADRRRLAAGVLATGLAVMLILLLDGMWAGIRAQATVYPDRVGANLFVLQPGVRDLTAGASTLPLSTVAGVRADPDVRWADPVRTAYVILQLHGVKVPAYLVGAVPGRHGGPWSLVAGRAPAGVDEVTVGQVLAERHGIGVGVGDRLSLFGRSLRVVGLSRSTGFLIDYVFVTHAALQAYTGGFDEAHRAPCRCQEGVQNGLRGAAHGSMVRTMATAAGCPSGYRVSSGIERRRRGHDNLVRLGSHPELPGPR